MSVRIIKSSHTCVCSFNNFRKKGNGMFQKLWNRCVHWFASVEAKWRADEIADRQTKADRCITTLEKTFDEQSAKRLWDCQHRLSQLGQPLPVETIVAVIKMLKQHGKPDVALLFVRYVPDLEKQISQQIAKNLNCG